MNDRLVRICKVENQGQVAGVAIIGRVVVLLYLDAVALHALLQLVDAVLREVEVYVVLRLELAAQVAQELPFCQLRELHAVVVHIPLLVELRSHLQPLPEHDDRVVVEDLVEIFQILRGSGCDSDRLRIDDFRNFKKQQK